MTRTVVPMPIVYWWVAKGPSSDRQLRGLAPPHAPISKLWASCLIPYLSRVYQESADVLETEYVGIIETRPRSCLYAVETFEGGAELLAVL